MAGAKHNECRQRVAVVRKGRRAGKKRAGTSPRRLVRARCATTQPVALGMHTIGPSSIQGLASGKGCPGAPASVVSRRLAVAPCAAVADNSFARPPTLPSSDTVNVRMLTGRSCWFASKSSSRMKRTTPSTRCRSSSSALSPASDASTTVDRHTGSAPASSSSATCALQAAAAPSSGATPSGTMPATTQTPPESRTTAPTSLPRYNVHSITAPVVSSPSLVTHLTSWVSRKPQTVVEEHHSEAEEHHKRPSLRKGLRERLRERRRRQRDCQGRQVDQEPTQHKREHLNLREATGSRLARANDSVTCKAQAECSGASRMCMGRTRT